MPQTFFSTHTSSARRFLLRLAIGGVVAGLVAVALPAMHASVTVAHASPGTASSTAPSTGERLIEWNPRKEGAVFLKNVRDMKKVPGAPKSFRHKLHKELRSIWRRELNGAPECKQVGGIQVWSLRTDGYAVGNVVSQVGNTGCETGASGAVVFWVKRDGAWRRAIETADIVECAKLERIEFPSELGIDRCFDGTDVVDYHQD